MTSTIEIFDRLTSGRLPDKMSKEFSTLIRPFQVDFEYMVNQLKTNSAQVFRSIYVDIVDNRSVNALAFLYKKQEFVGINAGTGISIPFIFLSLLSSPDVLLSVGDITVEERHPASLNHFLLSGGKASLLSFSDFPSSSLLHPKSDLRYHHAAYLSSRALAPVVSRSWTYHTLPLAIHV